jgi:hypothetical protein
MRTHSVSSSPVILAGRVVLLGIAAGAVVLGFVVSRTADDRPAVVAVLYVCPMHQKITSSAPGDCPICRMALEPATAHSDGDQPAHIAAAGSAPAALTLPESAKLRRFEAFAPVSRFETSLEMRAPAWAESGAIGVALLHRDEAELLKPDEEALFYPSTRPKDGSPPGIKVHATNEPPVGWDRATVLVRFHVDSGARLSPDQTGSIKFATRIRKGLVVRASAVLESPEGPYVLVVAADRRTLTKRPIVIGTVLYGYAALVSGLRENESVAVTRTFFLDAERRLRGGGL